MSDTSLPGRRGLKLRFFRCLPSLLTDQVREDPNVDLRRVGVAVEPVVLLENFLVVVLYAVRYQHYRLVAAGAGFVAVADAVALQELERHRQGAGEVRDVFRPGWSRKW